jgi:hypothetical protein
MIWGLVSGGLNRPQSAAVLGKVHWSDEAATSSASGEASASPFSFGLRQYRLCDQGPHFNIAGLMYREITPAR